MLGNQISLTNNVAKQVISVTATQGQTDFTVEGGYRINQLGVYRNGVRLVDGRDFVARNGATVTLLSQGANGDDAMEFVVFDDFRVADALSVNSGGTVNASVNITGALQMGTGTSIFSPADNTLTLGTNDSEGVRIKSDGDLVIPGNASSKNIEYGDGTTSGFFLSKTNVNRSSADAVIHNHQFRWNGTKVAEIKAITGDDTTNKDNGHLTFGTANAGTTVERFRVSSSGNVSIGTSTGLGKLHVRAADECNYVVREESTALVLSAETNSGRDNNRQMSLEGSIFTFTTSGTERLRITSGGDVGVGTDNPATKLVVVASDSTAADMRFQNSSTGYAANNGMWVGINNNEDGLIYNYHNSPLIFGTNDTEQLRIDSSGNLKLGTATLGIPASGFPPNTFFVGRKAAIRSVTVSITLDGSGAGTFDLGRIHYNDDESFEIFISICKDGDSNLKTSYCKAFCQKVRGTGLTDFVIDRQDSADSGFSVSSLSSGTAQGVSGHGFNVNVTGGDASSGYTCTALIHSVSKNNLY